MGKAAQRKTTIVEFSQKFKRDLAKLAKSDAKLIISHEFSQVINYLINGIPLPAHYHDHALSGEMIGFRDCHIFNDLLLLYQLTETETEITVSFVRLGSHSELFR